MEEVETTTFRERTPGNDVYYLGSGGDSAVDGRGNDLYYGGESDDAFVVGRYGPGGTDSFFGGLSTTGNAVVYGGAGTFTADLSAGVTGGVVGVDSLLDVSVAVGGDGANTLIGDGTDNRLFGGDGDDHIEGLAGNDRLYGGAGTDYLDGGDDTDNCDFGETVLNCEGLTANRVALRGQRLSIYGFRPSSRAAAERMSFLR